MRKLCKMVLAYGPWKCWCGYEYSTDAEGAAHMREAHGES